ELVDINFGIRRGSADWIHMNSVDYNAKLDQIVLSARWFDEAWVIDHSTTMEEAAGHSGGKHGTGGDLLYRWGNPESYFAGFPFDRQFYAQHDVRWIDDGLPGEGNFLIFNNGDRRADRGYSSVDEFKPPLLKDGSYQLPADAGFGPDAFSWSYKEEGVFYSERISGAQRLPNGNTLICAGSQAWAFEVTSEGQRVWEFEIGDIETGIRSEAGLFRAPFYAKEYAGIKALLK
ncbi:MAG: aryl-sulfate sulfotransferase, partial [Planctomycetota bacterium]